MGILPFCTNCDSLKTISNYKYLCAMQKLLIKDIQVHAFHGCLQEEAKIGAAFSVEAVFEGDFSLAMDTDDLSKAIDYVKVHQIVRAEMAIRSNLIEHVAARILRRLKTEFPLATHCSVSVTKYNPPVNGQLGCAVFVVSA